MANVMIYDTFMAVTIRTAVFWNVASCIQVAVYKHYTGIGLSSG
jgi:hypothetical protein